MSDETFKYRIKLNGEFETHIVECDDVEATREHYILKKNGRVIANIRQTEIDIFQEIE